MVKQLVRSTDLWAGLMFLAFGAVAVYIARDYPLGAAMRMGPGYFPTYLGVLLMIMGVVIAARGIIARNGEQIGVWAFRPLLILSASILIFAYAMDALGFVPALVLLILGSSLASREFRLLEALVLAAVLVAGAVAIFIYGIELPYRLFWWSY
jgi:hypothetical protein